MDKNTRPSNSSGSILFIMTEQTKEKCLVWVQRLENYRISMIVVMNVPRWMVISLPRVTY